jgi:hypothetical protein
VSRDKVHKALVVGVDQAPRAEVTHQHSGRGCLGGTRGAATASISCPGLWTWGPIEISQCSGPQAAVLSL